MASLVVFFLISCFLFGFCAVAAVLRNRWSKCDVLWALHVCYLFFCPQEFVQPPSLFNCQGQPYYVERYAELPFLDFVM